MNTCPNIPPWPQYEEDEREAVHQVLLSGKTNYWGGLEGTTFEEEFASWCGTNFALGVFNGTVALEVALRSVGINTGDEVIVTPRSFLASVSSVVAIGAIPVFADIDFESGNLTAQSIAQVATERTRGIVVVHLGGWPADMPAIVEFANEHGIQVIEDCAQSHGATIEGKMVGSFGHVAAFSFCQDKIMSTGGEGGMITTNNDQVRDIAWSLRDHGRNREQTLSNEHPFGFRWTQDRIGTNGRMTEIQATIGRCQLRKVDAWVQQRSNNARQFVKGLAGCQGLHFPSPADGIMHAYYRLPVTFESGKERDRVVQELQSSHVPVAVGPCPEIYLEKAIVELGLVPNSPLPKAEELGKRSMVLLVHPGIESVIPAIIDQITRICD